MNLNILYEDTDILVCVKPAGTATQSSHIGTPDMVSLLKNHIHSPYLAVIHRLDQPVEGILVFGKTPFAAKELNKQLQQHSFGKHYYARVLGTPSEQEGILEDYLVKDGRTNTSRVCTENETGAKKARLHYKVLEHDSSSRTTLLEITLETGRHHQIRVQLAAMGHPIVGDRKYTPPADIPPDGFPKKLELCAYKLEFIHPKTKKCMQFQM